MGFLKQEDLKLFTEPQGGWCVSIYMPTVDKSHEVRQNPIRFKNLLERVADDLRKAGLTGPEIQELLSPARALLENGTFWQRQEKGLAVFFAPGVFKTYRLPMPVEEIAMVNDRFHIKPLLPLLNHGEFTFFILALALDEVRLYKATQETIEEVKVPNMPPGMEEALGYESMEGQTQHPSSSNAPRGGMFHGHSEADDVRKSYILNYFRMVDKAVTDYLHDNARNAPLILAAVEYLPPIYEEANNYPHLMKDVVIEGSPHPPRMRKENLRDEGWQLIKSHIRDSKADLETRYRALSGSKDKRAIKDLKEVVKAAPYGRVEVLFVDKNAKQWGTFDANNVDVKFEKEPRPGNHDLLDFAAVQTLLNGGAVYVVDPQEVPEGGSPVAAILRY